MATLRLHAPGVVAPIMAVVKPLVRPMEADCRGCRFFEGDVEVCLRPQREPSLRDAGFPVCTGSRMRVRPWVTQMGCPGPAK